MPIRLLAAIFIVTLLSFKAVGQDPIDFSFDCVDADPGEEVCIPIAVTNFEDIISLFISFSYDPSVLRFDRIDNDILPLGGSSNPGPGEVVYLWTDPSPMFDGVTIPDGGVVFELCFEVIGIPGSSSLIDLTSNFNQEVRASGKVSVVHVMTTFLLWRIIKQRIARCGETGLH